MINLKCWLNFACGAAFVILGATLIEATGVV